MKFNCWMAGAANPADLFTKEDNDVKHLEILQDQMAICEKRLIRHCQIPKQTISKLSIQILKSIIF